MRALFPVLALLGLAALSAQADIMSFSTFIPDSAINSAAGQNNAVGLTHAGNKFVGTLYEGSDNASSPVEGYYYPEDIPFASAIRFTDLAGDATAPVMGFVYSGDSGEPFNILGIVDRLPDQSVGGIFLDERKVSDITALEPASVVLFGTLAIGVAFTLRRKMRQ